MAAKQTEKKQTKMHSEAADAVVTLLFVQLRAAAPSLRGNSVQFEQRATMPARTSWKVAAFSQIHTGKLFYARPV